MARKAGDTSFVLISARDLIDRLAAHPDIKVQVTKGWLRGAATLGIKFGPVEDGSDIEPEIVSTKPTFSVD